MSRDIIVTSRDLSFPDSLILQDFSWEDACAFVSSNIVENLRSGPDDIVNLLNKVSSLPLVLFVACSYIRENNGPVRDFLEQYEQQKRCLLIEGSPEHSSLYSVYHMVLVSLKRQNQRELCKKILIALACLDPVGVPPYFFDDLDTVNPSNVKEALQILVKNGLISGGTPPDVSCPGVAQYFFDSKISMHRLMQQTVRAAFMDKRQQKQFEENFQTKKEVLQWVDTKVKDYTSNYGFCFVEHPLRTAALCGDEKLFDELRKAGMSLDCQGQHGGLLHYACY